MLGKVLPFDSLRDLRVRMVKAAPALGAIDEATAAPWGDFGALGDMDSQPFESAVTNFYMTDPISRASATMAECAAVFGPGRDEATGTDG